MMSINAGYKIAIECFAKESLKKKIWLYGDKFVENFSRKYDINLRWECIEQENDGVNGYEVECFGLGLSTTGWHGTKEGGKRIAGWKWIERLFRSSGANLGLYWSIVKKYAKEMININEHCSICGFEIENGELWEHLLECVRNQERSYHLRETDKIKIECGLCEQKIKLDNYQEHLKNCKKRPKSLIKIEETQSSTNSQREL